LRAEWRLQRDRAFGRNESGTGLAGLLASCTFARICVWSGDFGLTQPESLFKHRPFGNLQPVEHSKEGIAAGRRSGDGKVVNAAFQFQQKEPFRVFEQPLPCLRYRTGDSKW
jgi:hypothetical protein